MTNIKNISIIEKEMFLSMKCNYFRENLIDYIENRSSIEKAKKMREHIENCSKCENLYKEKLEIADSLSDMFNTPNIIYSSQIQQIIANLDEKYYSKSFINKISYHLRKNILRYSASIAAVVLLIAAVPIMKNYVFSRQNPIKASSASNNSASIKRSNIVTNSFNGQLLEIPNPLKVAVGYSVQDSKSNKTTSQIAKSYNAIAAVNAGSFLTESDHITHGGVIIHDGNIVFNDLDAQNKLQNIIGFKKDGLLVIGEHTVSELKEMGIKEAVTFDKNTLGFGLPLIVNGKAVSSEFGTAKDARTAIGQKTDGSVLFLVINGRDSKYIGASLLDVQKILLDHGAVNAATLAGGSHSSIYYDGKVISTPCSQSGERAEPSIFMVMP